MIHAYDDEDNAPMFGEVPLPYRIRTWEEFIREWEGKDDADGQSAISGRLEGDRVIGEREGRLDLPGVREAVPEAG